MNKPLSYLQIPTRWVGPIALQSDLINGDVMVPMSTFESPLWPSVNRGARVSRACGGIHAVILRDCMTRSIIMRAASALDIAHVRSQLQQHHHQIATAVEKTSAYLKFIDCDCHQVGNLGYFRLVIDSQNASGHNMVTKAAEALITWLQSMFDTLQYVSISGNICTDKKNSAINGLLGRGKEVIAELRIPRHICDTMLRTTPEKIVALHTQKNLIGSIVAGSLRSANAHFANMLLAIYLATGQDAANIIEGSQGIVHTEVTGEHLYFSVTLPNIIVGTVGNGKTSPDTYHHLKTMHCDPAETNSAQKLSLMIAAAVLCGELSLLAAQTNPGELIKAHLAIERRQQKDDVA
jgi:hydroxymethylglutaryl-CoA reductase (NADPH)